MGLRIRQIQVQVFWTLKTPEPQFPHLQNGDRTVSREGSEERKCHCLWEVVAAQHLSSPVPAPS